MRETDESGVDDRSVTQYHVCTVAQIGGPRSLGAFEANKPPLGASLTLNS